jgi:hypothetical protein
VGRRQLERRRVERGGRAGNGADHSGGLGEAETGGVDAEHHSARRRQQLQRHVFLSGANGSMQGSNYTDALKAAACGRRRS